MWIQNKYTKWYFGIINNAKHRVHDRTVHEHHHIIPRSIDRSIIKDPNNIVSLTHREHYIAHWLLIKSLEKPVHQIKMKHAFWAMCSLHVHGRRNPSRYYTYAKRHLIDARSKRVWTDEQRQAASIQRKGRKAWNRGLVGFLQGTHKENLTFKGKKHTEETKNLLRGRTHSAETRNKISSSQKGKNCPNRKWNVARKDEHSIIMKGSGNYNAKTYIITNINTGTEQTIVCLKTFCIDNGLNYGSIATAYLNKKPYKGLIFQRVN